METPSLGRTKAHLNNYLDLNTFINAYHRNLLSFFNITGIRNTYAETTGVTYLTDDDGKVFRDLAVKAVEDEINISLFNKIYDLMTHWGEYEERGEKTKFAGEIKEIGTDEIPEEIKTLIKDSPEEINPSWLFSLITNGAGVSGKSINKDATLSSREAAGLINMGNSDNENSVKSKKDDPGLYEKFMLGEFFVRHMSDSTSKDSTGALRYEIEYIISGKGSDEENLKSVVYRIFLVREGLNIAKFENDEKKCAEAEALATALSMAVLNPELAPVLKHGILVLWATKESRDDMEKLLNGEKADYPGDIKLDYKDHLRALLLMTPVRKETWRGMDMMEANMRVSNPGFRLDGCITEMEAKMIYENRFREEFVIDMRKSYEK